MVNVTGGSWALFSEPWLAHLLTFGLNAPKSRTVKLWLKGKIDCFFQGWVCNLKNLKILIYIFLRLKEHVDDPDKLPILIFPEGTCINNTSVMQFKKGSFEVGSVVYPVAIKVIFFVTIFLSLYYFCNNVLIYSVI